MNLFSPMRARCILCEASVNGAISICEACRADLPNVEHACKRCAIPLPEPKQFETSSDYCGECLNLSHDNYIDYSINLYHYHSPVDYLIRQMKFQQQLSAAAVLADLLSEYIGANPLEHGLPKALIPVPLHKTRLAKRGFNQSLEIIKPFAKAKQIPILLDSVVRLKPTKTQTHLNKKQRKQNVSGCFKVLHKTLPSHLVIVDDVVTTGATTNELAKVLKKMGVEKVGVWSLARAELAD